MKRLLTVLTMLVLTVAYANAQVLRYMVIE